MNHWPECIDFWRGASLGLGDTDCSNEVPGVTNGHALRGHNFIQFYIAETFKYIFLMNHWPTCIDI